MHNKTMNILQFTTSNDLGGAEKIVLDIISHKSENLNYILVSLRGAGYLHEIATKYGVPVYFLDMTKPLQIFKLHSIIKKHHIDIIQTHGVTAQTIASLFINREKTKLLSTFHDLNDFHGIIKSTLFKLSNHKVDHWISVTKAGALLLEKRYHVDPDRIHVILNGITVEFPNEPLSKDLNGQVRILTVANLKKKKGHESLLMTAKRLKDKGYDNFRFVFVGRDDSDGRLQNLARSLNIMDMIEFAGFQSEISTWYLNAHIFCLPSSSEGLPLAILEAMYAGLPVISTPVGGIPEAILHEQTGLLVPHGDPEKLCESIIHLAENPELRKKLGANARQRVMADFSLTDMVSGYEKLFSTITTNTVD